LDNGVPVRSAHLAHFGSETVAAFGDSLNKSPFVLFVEGFSQQRYGVGDIAFLDEGIAPDGFKQLFARDYRSTLFDQ
jgi:hypothetical protein